MVEVQEALLETLRTASGTVDLEYATPPSPLAGGFYAEMLRFTLQDPPPNLRGELVARIIPKALLGEWEATIQREVGRQGFASPAVRLTAPETSPIGRFLLVMDFVQGTPPLDGLTARGIVTQLPQLVRTLPGQLAKVSADLHRLDPQPLAGALAALDTELPTTLTGFIRIRIDDATAIGRTDLALAGERLVDTEPTTSTRVICHGDLHPFNVLVTDHGMVLIDWSVARIAHPAFDLAFTQLMVANPPLGLPTIGERALQPIARHLGRAFLRRYRELADPIPDLDDAVLEWHCKVHALRALVELAGWDASGTRPSSHPWIVLEPMLRSTLGV